MKFFLNKGLFMEKMSIQITEDIKYGRSDDTKERHFP